MPLLSVLQVEQRWEGLNMSFHWVSLVVIHITSSFSTPSRSSDRTCLAGRRMSVSLTTSASASDFLWPSHIYVETERQGSQASPSEVQSCRLKFLMKTVEAGTQLGWILVILWLSHSIQIGKSHAYVFVCVHLCPIHTKHRKLTCTLWQKSHEKKEKKRMRDTV